MNHEAPIPFNVPFSTGREAAYVAEVLGGRQHAGNGPFTRRCQAWLAARFDVPHVLLTTSCTAALELSAMALGLGPGDEVIMPSFTFVATATAFHRTGATLVFADIDADTMMITADTVAPLVTPRTRAVVPMHYGGLGCEMDALVALAAQHGAAVVEDAAQGLDARRDGRPLGAFGRFGAFSFHETKNIHCGLGGALFVNDAADFDRVEDIWERGSNRTKMFRGLVDKYSWVAPGSSFYPAELQAAFLLAQLEALDENTALRLAIWNQYDARLAEGERAGWFRLQRRDAACARNGHLFYLRTASEASCEALRLHLLEHGIQAHIHYQPLHTSAMGRAMGGAPGQLPVTEATAPCLLRMPLHHQLEASDVDRVCDTVLAAFRDGNVPPS